MAPSDNNLLREAIRALERRFPPGWSLQISTKMRGPRQSDALVTITAPSLRSGVLVLELRTQLEPKSVRMLVEAARTPLPGPLVVVAPYLSESTRARLRESEVGYLDLTGNARIVMAEPGLYIETAGATENPDRESRPTRSLRGAKVGRIVRALVDHQKPPGVRELAVLTKLDAGYVSRVLALLENEALITRAGRGRTQSVDWPALLRRWANELPLGSRGSVSLRLDPRGLSALTNRLRDSEEHYAVTGSLAAASFAPLTPARLGMVWIDDAERAGTRLGLRPTDAGANVMLIEPHDEGVFVGAEQRDGVWVAAPSQIAADLLTSPGRGPAEAEALIEWMQASEDAWRR